MALVALLCGFARGQHPVYYTLNDDNILPTNELYEVVQDEFGLVWMGSSNGLFRFDGVRVVELVHEQQKGITMTAVYPDQQGRIWCQNVSRQVFRVQDDSLHLVMDGSDMEALKQIVFHPDGSLILLRGKQVQWQDAEGRMLKEWSLEQWLQGDGHILDAAARDGMLFLLTHRQGLLTLELASGEVRRLDVTDGTETGGFNFKGEGTYLVRLAKGSNHLRLGEYRNGTFDYFHEETLPPQVRVLRVVPLGTDELMLCTSDGVIHFRRTVTGWQKGQHLFPAHRVSSVLRDQEGITWFSTLSQGVAVMVSPDLQLHQAHPQQTSSFTSLLTLEDGSMLLGTTAGELFHMRDSTSGMTPLPASVASNQRFSVKVLRNSPVGILVCRSAVSVLDPVTWQEKVLPVSNVRDMCVVGDTLYATFANFFRAYSLPDLLAGKEDAYHHEISSLGGKGVTQDPLAGGIYVSLHHGIFYWKGGRLTEVRHRGQSLEGNQFLSDSQGTWVVCNEVGLLFLQDGKVTRMMDAEMGLPSEYFGCATRHGDWMVLGSENHVCRLHLPTGKVVTLSRAIGIKPDGISRMTVSHGKLWMASLEGVLEMPLQFDPASGQPPKIRIERVELNGRTVPAETLLHLPPSGNSLKVTFQGISFRSKGNYSFKYRLKGLEEEWTTVGSGSNYVQYPTLPPGDLTFEVKVVDVTGRECEMPAQLHIHVDTPLLMRPYMIVVMALLGFALASGIFLLVLRVVRRRHLAHQQLIASQLTALKAQMNPHFMFNALNSIQDLVLSKDIRNSNLYLSKFSTLMRLVLTGSGKDAVRLSDEVDMLRLYLDLEKLRFGAEMAFEITLSPGLDPEESHLPSMVIQPFVENAIKHGLLHRKGAKRLSIAFAPAGDGLLVTIEDNGIGRRRSAEIRQRGKAHTSFSTAATVKRLDLIRSLHGKAVDLQITDLEQDGEATGTRVAIRLPFMKPE